MRPPFLDTQLYKMPWFCTERRGAPRNVLFSLKRGYGEMSEFSHQAGISKLRDKVAILPRHGVRHPHEEVSGVQEGEAVRLPPMSHLRSRPHFQVLPQPAKRVRVASPEQH